jgi:hypothetical protein
MNTFRYYLDFTSYRYLIISKILAVLIVGLDPEPQLMFQEKPHKNYATPHETLAFVSFILNQATKNMLVTFFLITGSAVPGT